VDLLQKSGIHSEFHTTPGEHEWKAWRHLLAELMPKLFQPAGKYSAPTGSRDEACIWLSAFLLVAPSCRACAAAPEPIISPEIGPDHRVTIRIRALRAGKAFYCEWPLGATLAEAEEMAGPGRER